jgi:hypothetical protein
MTRSSRSRLQVPAQGYGHEGDILRYMFFHSIALACLGGMSHNPHLDHLIETSKVAALYEC